MTEQEMIEAENICNPDKYVQSEKTVRYNELLKKSMHNPLTNDEYEEFKELSPIKVQPLFFADDETKAKLDDSIEKHNELMKKFEDFLNKQ